MAFVCMETSDLSVLHQGALRTLEEGPSLQVQGSQTGCLWGLHSRPLLDASLLIPGD